MSKCLINGIAALTVGLAMTSCMKEFTYEEQEQQASLDNAQQTLGFYIPDNQDWVMTGMVTANIPVNIKSGEVYTVKVYSNDPLTDGVGYVLATETVSNGQNFSTTFRAPSYKHAYYFGLTNSEGETIYRSANIEDGKLIEFNEDKVIVYDDEVSTSRTRAITVNGDNYNEFTAPTAEQIAAAFPTAVADGAEELATSGDYTYFYSRGASYNYKITSAGEYNIGGGWMNTGWVSDASYQNGGYTAVSYYNVYVNVDGNVTLKRNGDPHFNLYILKGNVTLDSNFGEMSGIISVASGATLNDNRASLKSNYGTQLFNRGTVNTGAYDINNNAAVYNEGTFIATGALSYSAGAGNTSFFMNMGDDCVLTAPSMTMNSTCHFFTDGTVNISGETKVTQSGITWINNGHYTTGSMVFSAKNTSFYNYCQLIVTGNCTFTDGLFNMMQNSYAEFGTAQFNNFRVTMANNSGINVKNGSKWGRQGSDFMGEHEMQGFVADNNEAKVYVRLGGQTYVPDHKGAAFHVYGENLTLAYENIKFYSNFNDITQYTAYGNVNYWDESTAESLAAKKSENTTWNTHNVTKFVTGDDFSKVNVETKTGQCAATWTIPGEPVIKEENQTYTYAFEDNKTKCDFDLNDVVIRVRESEDDATKLIVTLVAAGCQYDNYVWLGDTQISWDNKAEVHDAFGVSKGVMVNTGNGKGVDASFVTTTIDKPTGFDFQNADFKIRPYKVGSEAIDENAITGYITIVKEGNPGGLAEAPLGIVIPDKWKWPTERTNVTNAYEGFTAWGSQADLTLRAEDGGWYQNPTSGLVYGE